MAKPDWGELQRRFQSDHAATGVSPKDWCEAQEMNYATARRYINKPTAQKTEKREVRKTAQNCATPVATGDCG